MTPWKRDKAAEEGGTHRFYRYGPAVVERRYWPGSGYHWQVARTEDDYWEVTVFDTLSEAKQWVERNWPQREVALVGPSGDADCPRCGSSDLREGTTAALRCAVCRWQGDYPG